ncbi:aminopeptidase N [Phytohabitans sp. ZYX-F-186]|uniref:Aminopeptidase N n=1 Tax=Phytohabitans maris TaxID=3071409 RepID=A0ABU0Z792_9ACTN|nr:aminopeptidase N [Phytohabitans sp. ZYX-F-186]MDQ7902921.1 aminopeptidase N [Phytohabitans sp. ZYX-F-186]
MRSLTRAEAAERADLLTVESYTVELDVTGGPERFGSAVTVRFRSARPGAATFAEVKPAELRSARLNGTPLDVSTFDGNRLPLSGLAEVNELVVEADMAYSNTGEGLHRFVDPADGETYLYAMSFLDHAPRIFACFDQPDLKAPVTLTVHAPEGWLVAANGAAEGGGRFATTPPLATYFVSLVAGPFHARYDEHDGIPLGLLCRRSLAPHLDKDADEVFEITKACFDRFHELFGIRYPFGKYDQAFVPEFNAGAMENPGLVTLRDDYIFRSAVTDGDREWRAVVIAHEMAHQWFGDLVTMRWWDDLWLNESFAEYLGVRVTGESTRFDRSWTTFGLRRKASGYVADQRPSTHPVAPEEVADAAHALLNFDGISYAKGASVLRQLVASLGDEAFFAGLRAHFAAHRFGNATLADLLAALSTASGRDLSGWADLWLRRSGVDTLRAEVTTVDGRYQSVHIAQTGATRPHRVALGVYDGPALRQRVPVDVVGERTEVAELAGEPAADLLLVNSGDLTFAKVRLDPASAAAVPGILPALDDSLDRAVLWSTTIDSVRDGDASPADLVALVITALPLETEPLVVEGVLGMTRDLLDRYLDPVPREIALQPVAMACERLLATAPPGGSLQLAAARGLIEVSTDARRLAGWLKRQGVPEGLRIDTDLRWALCERLVVLGAAGPDRIEAELANDRSATGEQCAARCRAALPDPAAKAEAWRVVTEDTTLSNRLVEANAEGFWQPEQTDLTRSYVERYFAEMPAAARLRTPWAADQVAKSAFPRYAVAASTRKAAAALLARDDLEPGLRRVVIDADDDLRRALAARG